MVFVFTRNPKNNWSENGYSNIIQTNILNNCLSPSLKFHLDNPKAVAHVGVRPLVLVTVKLYYAVRRAAAKTVYARNLNLNECSLSPTASLKFI